MNKLSIKSELINKYTRKINLPLEMVLDRNSANELITANVIRHYKERLKINKGETITVELLIENLAEAEYRYNKAEAFPYTLRDNY